MSRLTDAGPRDEAEIARERLHRGLRRRLGACAQGLLDPLPPELGGARPLGGRKATGIAPNLADKAEAKGPHVARIAHGPATPAMEPGE